MKSSKILYAILAVTGGTAIGLIGLKSYTNHNQEDTYSSILMQNIEALTEDNDVNKPQTTCPPGHIPNRYITAEVIVHTSTSDKDASINIGGKVDGSYTHNSSSPIVIEVKNCNGVANGACCNPDDVGTRIL